MRRFVALLFAVLAVYAAALRVPRVPRPAGAEGVAAVLDSVGVEFDSISCALWGTIPDARRVTWRMAHTSDALLLHFVVREAGVRASVMQPNGPVYRDPCVELFIAPDTCSTVYYNLEMSCIGAALLQGGRPGRGRRLASPEVLGLVDICTSLGNAPVDFGDSTVVWQLAAVVPVDAFFVDKIATLDGITARGNIYKCGGAEPNYLSLFPVASPRPQFHRPESFGPFEFEKAADD